MSIADGRTDLEKARLLISGSEGTHVEFKSHLNLKDSRDNLNFVKDAVAMANTFPGGYIIVGVTDEGDLCIPSGSEKLADQFDGAKISEKIHKYIDARIGVIAQIHTIGENDIAMIFIKSPSDGFPIPFAKLGQCPDADGKQRPVFRRGDIVRRVNAQNVCVSYHDWPEILREHDRQLTEKVREDIDDLVKALAASWQRSSDSSARTFPLDLNMSNSAFASAVVANLDEGNESPIRRFIRECASYIYSEDHFIGALDKLTVVAIDGLYCDSVELSKISVDTLYNAYRDNATVNTEFQRSLLERIYIIGSAAVRFEKWKFINFLVLKPVTSFGGQYIYSSWIRHAQVSCSRAHVFPKDNTGLIITSGRDLLQEDGAMRPDVPDEALHSLKELHPKDNLLNSLMQFDLLYCLVVKLEGTGDADAYPASSAGDQSRVNPAYELIGTSPAVRQELFPSSSEGEVAEAMVRLQELASKESWRFGGFWGSLPPNAEAFVEQHSHRH